MKIFKVNDKIDIVCQYKSNRNGFKHEAVLMYNGIEVDKAKVCYYNRTWERYEYESVLNKLVDRTSSLSKDEKKECSDYIANYQNDSSFLKTVGTIAMLGEVFCEDRKSKNEWKVKMLKAGLGDNLTLPDDWDNLDEKTKQERLDNALDVIKK